MSEEIYLKRLEALFFVLFLASIAGVVIMFLLGNALSELTFFFSEIIFGIGWVKIDTNLKV